MRGLGQSLERANQNLTGKTVVWATEEGDHAAFQLRAKIPSQARKFLSAYVRQYMRACGWRVDRIRFPGYRIEFTFSWVGAVPRPSSPEKFREADAGRKKKQNPLRKTTS